MEGKTKTFAACGWGPAQGGDVDETLAYTCIKDGMQGGGVYMYLQKQHIYSSNP